MIVIEIAGKRAYIQDYRWHAKDKIFERLLNSFLDPHGSSGDDPYPDGTVATYVVKQLGGKIISDDFDYDE